MANEIQFDDAGNIIVAFDWRKVLKLAVVIALAAICYRLPIPGLSDDARVCLMIFVGAAGLWVTEAIPPFATAIMVIVLSVFLLGRPGGPSAVQGLENGYRIFLNPIASPTLVLFFGGFIMAVAATKHGFDVRLARSFLKPFGTKPQMVLLGIILITGLFSMFMSNTATTAMMIAILTPLFGRFEGRDPFKKALVLAVPFAANIGGMGTLIGTPPNAVAASVLAEMGKPVSFLTWMLIGVPFASIMLIFLWVYLIKVFKPREDHLEVLFKEDLKVTWDLLIVVITFIVTVVMWLTEPLHSIPAGVVALLPVLVFPAFGIISREDLRLIEWHVLILIAGGLTLGIAMQSTGLSTAFVNIIVDMGLPQVFLLVVLVLFSIVVSNFMSHTAAANLLIPIVTSVGAVSPLVSGVVVAFACSLAMSLPISTPPNALAFATRHVTTSDIARHGTVVSGVGVLMLVVLMLLFTKIFGTP